MYDGYFQLNPPVEGFYKIDSLIFDSIDPTTSDLDSYITKMTSLLSINNKLNLYTEYLSPFDSLLGDCV